VIWVYVAALIVGAGIMLMQVFLGHDADGDMHVDHEVSGSLLLSSRFWTFFALAFGLAGTLLTLFTLASMAAVLVIASTSGIASGAFAAMVIRALRQGQVTSGSSSHEAIGRVGELLIPCEKGRVGKVRLALKGQTVDLLAMAGDADLPVGTRVLIEDLEGDIARVTKAPEEIAS
jgi:membrane protein implicated in regulation of membrane protease activity